MRSFGLAGDGGAGDGGAGDGGAGDGGAGDGGAGDGGAGATMPLGGNSPLLNRALTNTADAVVGYWDPTTIGNWKSNIPEDAKDIGYLTSKHRKVALAGYLGSFFKVKDTGKIRDIDENEDALEPPFQRKKAAVTVFFNEKAVFSTIAPHGTDFNAANPNYLIQQLVFVRNYADLRVDRIPEISTQISDLISFFGLSYKLDTLGRKYTLELLQVVQGMALQIEMQAKHYCWTPRPVALDPRVQPMIQTPATSAFPAGHAAEAFALATVLHWLSKKQDPAKGIKNAEIPFRIAHRIALNRTVAGVHYPVDNAGGAMLGCMIGDAVIRHLISKTSHLQTSFQLPEDFSETKDFTFQWLQSFVQNSARVKTQTNGLSNASSIAKEFWTNVQSEWV